MSTITKEIEKHIRILVRPLRDQEELDVILRARLTKKEYKLLKAWAKETSVQEISAKLNLTEEQYGELSTKLIKKLNQEKLKQELMF
ncbi:MAG: hypothetical protein LT067_05995 [Sulfurovum sp.]|jgi:DNA-binding CsgD family transcriptional regulator|nr:hypothetical protein [Sulfurovum sp.]